MDFLGVVEEVGTDGNFVVRGVTTPDIGNPVFDSKERKIGSVKRVFGPVDGPYVSVTPFDKSILTNATGKKVYFKLEAKNAKDKRRY